MRKIIRKLQLRKGAHLNQFKQSFERTLNQYYMQDFSDEGVHQMFGGPFFDDGNMVNLVVNARFDDLE